VVDDGSEVEGPGSSLAALDSRVRVVRHGRPCGVAGARNRGIAESRGEWVAFLDDDDLWAPVKIDAQLAACASAAAEFSYTGVLVVDDQLDPQHLLSAPPAEEVGTQLLAGNAVGPPSSVLVRRALLDRTGGFDPAFSILADWDLWLRLAAGGRAVACPEPLTVYVLHSANMHSDLRSIRAEFRDLETKHKDGVVAPGRSLAGEQWRRWLAFTARGSGLRWRAAARYLAVGLRYRRSRDVARAAGVLMGERAMALGRRSTSDEQNGWIADTKWLASYRDRSAQELQDVG